MHPRRVLLFSTFALLCCAAVLLLEALQPFIYLRLRNFYRDAVSRAGRKTPPNPNLVFLAIDAASVSLDEEDIDQAYGLTNDNSAEVRALRLMSHGYPWSREIHALLLDRLIQAGAKVVIFDLLFTTPTNNDEPFQLALDRYREHVVIGSNFVDGSLTRPSDTLVPQTSPMDDRVAYTNFWADDDEAVRRAQYRVTFEQVRGLKLQPNSERFLSVAAAALIKSGSGHAVPPDVDAHAFRFTAAPQEGFPPHSIFEIFVPSFWKQNYQSGEFFRNKVVIVGAEGNWQHDDHPTPFGSMPGAELHLNAINAALHHEFIQEMSPSTRACLTVAAALVALALSLFVPSPWIRLLGLLICNTGAASIALYVFNHASIFVPMVAPAFELNSVVLFALIADFAFERLEKVRVRRTLERYVSRNIVHQMLDQPKGYTQSLGGVVKSVTILFSDIRGYSVVTARSDPQNLVTQLNEYLTAMVECVFRFGGTLDKFIGDAVMAVWGNIRTDGAPKDAANAVRAALAMQSELAELNEKWRVKNWPELRAGIAIHHGQVVVGNIGSPQRMEFTVIGDAVNISWKLQELTKEIGCDFIVSEQIRSLVTERSDFQSIGSATLKEIRDPIKLFTIRQAASALHRDDHVLLPVNPETMPLFPPRKFTVK